MALQLVRSPANPGQEQAANLAGCTADGSAKWWVMSNASLGLLALPSQPWRPRLIGPALCTQSCRPGLTVLASPSWPHRPGLSILDLAIPDLAAQSLVVPALLMD